MKVNGDDSYNIMLESDNNIYKFYGQKIIPGEKEPICKDYETCGWNILTRRNPDTGKLAYCYENKYTKERQFKDPRNDEGIIYARKYVCEDTDPEINKMIEVRRPFGEGHDCNNYYVIKQEYIREYESFVGRDRHLDGLHDKETACRIAGKIYDTLSAYSQPLDKAGFKKKKTNKKEKKT